MILFFVLFAVAIAQLLQKLSIGRALDDITATHHADRRIVEPDESFSIAVVLQNHSRRFVPFVRVREWIEEAFVPGKGTAAVSSAHLDGHYLSFSTWLRPRQQLVRLLPVSVSARGRYVLRDLTLYGGDFLGLKESQKTCGGFSEIVVIPKPAPGISVGEILGGFLGDLSVNRFMMEDPVLTLGYREYTGREPMKMISWTQSAKRNELMVRKPDYTVEPTVAVMLNTDCNLPDKASRLEHCFSLVRSVCDELEKRGVKYSFVSNAALAGRGGEAGASGEGLGSRHYAGIMEQLGRATSQPVFSAEQLLERESRRPLAAGRILITPDDLLPQRALNRLRESAGGNLLVIRASEVGPCS